MRALDKKMLKNLWEIRGQVIAIALVVGAAVATIVLSSGTYRSLELTRDLYYRQNRFADVFAGLKRAPDALEAAIAAIPGVSRVQTGIREYALIDMADVAEPVRGQIVSLPDEPGTGVNIPVLRAGNWPRGVFGDDVLVDEAFAEAHHLHPGDRLTMTINGRKKKLAVAGIALSPEFVYVIGPGDLVPDSRRFGVFWMNRKALASASNLQGAFNDVALGLRRGVAADDVIARLDRLLERYGGTGAYTRKDQLSDSFIESELRQLKTMTRIIPPIFMVTAIFLLNIAINRLVDAERGQIGLLKALGYKDTAIGLHYLQIALAITMAGIILGWLAGARMGYGMTRLYIEYYRFPVLQYQVTADVFLGAAFVSLAAACAGALAAIRKAMRLAPAIAMLPPPPPVYHTSLTERAGLVRGLSPSERMVVRHLAHWPARSGFTVLGIAMSIALLLACLHFYDSVDTMLDSFFYRNNRQNLTVSFTEIRPGSVVGDMRHLPGVLNVELQRNVPARLAFGHLSKRVVIEGLDPGAELSRPLDVHGAEIFLPENGIVLNERLAQQLNARQGDMLEVHVLEGRMPLLFVPVTGISREYIGLSAYMNRAALNALLREGPAANAAMIQADRTMLPKAYEKLKEMPFVAGVSSQDAAVRLFRRMIEENIYVMVGFYVLFAAILAFGVIYNNARLTLIERAREFSLMRVLGFHKAEVGWILGGEVALLTFLAIPFGCVMGYGLVALIVKAFSTDLYRLPFAIEPSSYGFSVSAILATAMVSGMLALYRLGELDMLGVLKERE